MPCSLSTLVAMVYCCILVAPAPLTEVLIWLCGCTAAVSSASAGLAPNTDTLKARRSMVAMDFCFMMLITSFSFCGASSFCVHRRLVC